MNVYKFGGASIASPERMLSLLPIIHQAETPLLVVVSAYGKTTNALEEVVELAWTGRTDEALHALKKIEAAHNTFAAEVLGSEAYKELIPQLEEYYTELEWAIDDVGLKSSDYFYDQIVAVGELLSSTIFSAVLKRQNVRHQWMDARDLIRTDDNFRRATVDEAFTKKRVGDRIVPALEEKGIVLTQGFIGATDDNASTTLGREGSDYSAALLAAFLDAKSVCIWKDVAGFLNADPKQFKDTIKIDQISFHEVVEMTYYGAQIIHPKTIKPLQNKGIPLHVKCFLEPSKKGTLIHATDEFIQYPPLLVLKENQVLLQLTSRDFSFMTESNIADIYQTFHRNQIKINMIQNAAISLVICVDNDVSRIRELIEIFEKDYKVWRNEALTLLTIRHYDDDIVEELTKGKKILLEQKTRTTLQVLY